MDDTGKILELIKALRASPDDSEKFYELGVLFGRSRQLSCGRERETRRAKCNGYCCAEWALRRAWVYAPQDPRPPWALDRVLKRPPKNMRLPHPGAVTQYKDKGRRVDFLHSLGLRGGPVYEQALLSFIENPNVTIRRGAVLGLGEIGNPSFVQRLIMILEHDAHEVQAEAAVALGLIGDPRAVDPLIARCVAADEVIPPTADEEQTGEFRAGLSDFFENVALSNVRANSAWALGMIADERAVKTLSQPLPEHDSEFRAEAVRALAHYGRPDLLPDIISYAKDSESMVRSAAIDALSMFLNEVDAVKTIEKIAEEDPDADVRFTAANMLGKEFEPPPEPVAEKKSMDVESSLIEFPEFDLAPPPDMPEPPE
ncbi:MAG: HEAT repeat domain-containing protein [Planctomycetota bacterium]|nr:MAG: HEAT repeat domain-containing protein [Planctomycetota bacterium]